MRAAALFDVDGTLVDSNYLHVTAWMQALAAVGHPVDAWRVHRCIGMGSAQLLDTLLGPAAARLGERATAEHAERYRDAFGQLRALSGARELIGAVAASGLSVVLATSARPVELDRLRAVLGADDKLAALVSSQDVPVAKPAPDLVTVALERAGVPAGRAVFVGDTVWDVRAAGRAGVACVGLRSGGIAAAELTGAGAVAVYDDPADLLGALPSSPLGALAGYLDRR